MIFKTEITVPGSGGARARVYSNPQARVDMGEGFRDLDARTCEQLAEELATAAERLRKIDGALK